MTSTVAIDRVGHMLRVPVQVAGDTYPFLLDTGIGITVVSSAFAARSDVSYTSETFAGRRMSGQIVEAPLVRLPALTLADRSVEGHIAAVADLGTGFAGILGPSFFDGITVTIDPDQATLTVDPAAAPSRDDVVSRIDVRRNGPSWDPFVSLVLPSGRVITVELDIGSPTLILHTRYLADCGLTLDSPSVETTTGTDETGYEWTRRWATIRGAVHLQDAPQTAYRAPRAMFQDIIYDGLIGMDYLERYRFTLDVSGARLVLSSRRSVAT